MFGEVGANAEICPHSVGPVLPFFGGDIEAEIHIEDPPFVGHGEAVPLTPDSGGFWFFGPSSNFDMLVEVIDGCAINNHFWVFAAATTNVEYTLTVTDTQTNEQKQYFNPLGGPADPILDTQAFATCP